MVPPLVKLQARRVSNPRCNPLLANLALSMFDADCTLDRKITNGTEVRSRRKFTKGPWA